MHRSQECSAAISSAQGKKHTEKSSTCLICWHMPCVFCKLEKPAGICYRRRSVPYADVPQQHLCHCWGLCSRHFLLSSLGTALSAHTGGEVTALMCMMLWRQTGWWQAVIHGERGHAPSSSSLTYTALNSQQRDTGGFFFP